MTIQHAVVAFPKFEAVDRIDVVRRRFDPLSAVLSAHVTLVFPFEHSDGSFSLVDHVAVAARGEAPITIALAGPTVEDDEYLMLSVTAGADILVALHDRLYSGPLARHLSRALSYRPHVTVGRLGASQDTIAAVAEARATISVPGRGRIDSLAIFRLEHGSRGVVECTVPLGHAD